MRGIVKAFDVGKGYGFIKGEDGKEYLVYFMAVQRAVQALKEGIAVEFTAVNTPKGPQAVGVTAR